MVSRGATEATQSSGLELFTSDFFPATRDQKFNLLNGRSTETARDVHHSGWRRQQHRAVRRGGREEIARETGQRGQESWAIAPGGGERLGGERGANGQWPLVRWQ
jgi:hypothetical protein